MKAGNRMIFIDPDIDDLKDGFGIKTSPYNAHHILNHFVSDSRSWLPGL